MLGLLKYSQWEIKLKVSEVARITWASVKVLTKILHCTGAEETFSYNAMSRFMIAVTPWWWW